MVEELSSPAFCEIAVTVSLRRGCPELPDLSDNLLPSYVYICIVCIRPGVAQWLGHCATSRTVSGSIPGGVTGDFFP